MKTIQHYFKKAKSEGFAIGAFNAANIETIKAIIAAAQKLKSPVIIESSHGEVEFIRPKNLIDIVKNYRQETGLPIFTNLDHGPTVEDCKQAIKDGFDLVHYNGANLPLEENIKKTKELVKLAHKHDILIEAELGKISGSSSLHKDQTAKEAQAEGVYTDPEEAKIFATKTKTDTLATFFGNVHGMFKTAPKLDLQRLQEIAKKTNCFLSLHGGSGIPDDQVKKAIKLGIVKVNVNSELRLTYKNTLTKDLNQTNESAIYKIMPHTIEAVQEVVEEKIKLFGSKDKA